MRKKKIKCGIYDSQCRIIPGSSEKELLKIARAIYHREENKSKRTAYIRSSRRSYLKGQKVFLNLFFEHLKQKSYKDRVRRLKYFEAGLDLVRNNPYAPTSTRSRSDGDALMRFQGRTKEGLLFFVQLRRNPRQNHYLMSVFPAPKQ